MSEEPRLRLLLLCEGDAETWDSWSGISKSVVDHLRAIGHSVTCFDVDLRGAVRLLVAASTVTWSRRRWWVRYHLGTLGFLSRSRRAQRFVDANAGRFDAVLQIGATFQVRTPKGIPVALYCDSNIELSRDGMASGQSEAAVLTDREAASVRARETRVYAGADRIFTMSDLLRTRFIERFGITPSQVVTVHGGANFSHGGAPEVPAHHPNSDPVALFVGRAFMRKGGDLLLRAFRRVRMRLPAAKLIIIGPRSLPEAHQADEGIEFLGFVDKDSADGQATLLDAYARSRVFCLPTRFEPFGVVFLEAMQHEIACIGPDTWAVPEIIDHGKTGLLVPPEDEEALVDALVTLLEDAPRAREMGRAGRRRVYDRFTWDLVVKRMVASLRPAVVSDGSP